MDVAVIGSGVTEVTYTDYKTTGYLEICKTGVPGGSFMVDQQGRRLEFHGANLVAKCGSDTHPSKVLGHPCLPGGHGHPDYVLTPRARDRGWRFTARDAANLHRLGFSLVRLGVIWAAIGCVQRSALRRPTRR